MCGGGLPCAVRRALCAVPTEVYGPDVVEYVITHFRRQRVGMVQTPVRAALALHPLRPSYPPIIIALHPRAHHASW
jgi:hypothetical protein